MVFQLVFDCTLPIGLKKDDLQKVAEKAKLMNEARAVTGILICKEGAAVQVIEGEKETVKSLYDWIRTDSRITNARILGERFSARREFSGWSMVYRHSGDLSEIFNPRANTTVPKLELANQNLAKPKKFG